MSANLVGFIGLGNMGYHMAKNIAQSGRAIVVYDVRTEAAEALSDTENVVVAKSVKEVADRAETVLVSLPNAEIIENVAIGENGLISGAAIKTYIDLSTSGEKAVQKISEKLAERGISSLDAPVSGGPPGAKEGKLTIMVAGDKDLFDAKSDLLNALGKKIFYVSDSVGKAQIMKVINNLLSSAAMAISSEAVVLGVKAGLDPNLMIDVLNASSGRNSATEDKFKKSIISRKFDWGFLSELAYKDMKLCMEVSEEYEVPMYLGTNITHFWRYAITQGAGKEDFTAIIKYFEDWAGIQVGESLKHEADAKGH
ncbi:NAD(P)-dependent oxidoreductase [Planomicrobium sp. CPCC 101079]|uniref:NAD(P)-dependent oxidoreductase n=1 Tax=Planomicrobium sp. CPCC 101079 TaxID=2599618 RepID=UPI0011B6CFBE|nr:NAD(P)-dependent oxidoreductase [Planomicrobium sp. CPCC 101079]TWT01872.1 NAD(P)-dependent oxidoreductase [Planomicrobium sp. CPCC 101079]